MSQLATFKVGDLLYRTAGEKTWLVVDVLTLDNFLKQEKYVRVTPFNWSNRQGPIYVCFDIGRQNIFTLPADSDLFKDCEILLSPKSKQGQ